MVHILKVFPWSSMPDSIHMSLAHSAELMERYDGYGLGNITEEQSEKGQRHVRNLRETHARKDSFEHNIQGRIKS